MKIGTFYPVITEMLKKRMFKSADFHNLLITYDGPLLYIWDLDGNHKLRR